MTLIRKLRPHNKLYLYGRMDGHFYRYTSYSLVIVLVSYLLSSCSGNLSQVTLLEDGFEELPVGYISSDAGALTEYHYLPGTGQAGAWTVTSYRWNEGYHTAWEIVGSDSGNILRQNFYNVDEKLDPFLRHTHPMIIAGDSIWHDYMVEFVFTPETLMDKCGIVFRYQNSRCYYFYGMEGNSLVLKMVNHATAPHRPYEKILASSPFNWERGKSYKGEISIRENQIYTLLEDSLSMFAEDNTYPRGKIGLLSDIPAVFHKVKVSTLKREQRKMSRYTDQLSKEASRLIQENSRPVLWKKIQTPGFGAGRNIRFGDLNNDGEMDLVIGQVVHHGPKDKYSELSCITAMTFDGEILWQKGVPDKDNYLLTNDVAFQIHDIDGDGEREVIYTKDFYIHIVEGKSGKVLRRKLTPLSRPPGDKYKRILGDCIYFCDLQGKGRDSDILIKDRYWNVWAYDEHLNLLWSQSLKTGHYPYAHDVDGDGKDEIAMGYSLLDDDGSFLWTRDEEIGDHADGVMISSMGIEADSSLKVIYAASDWGMMILDTAGNVERHHPVGHVQNPSLANFRQDLPGLEMVSINFWGNQGIIHFYNAAGEIYHSFEPLQYGSMMLPVNWKGDGEEYFLLNTSPGDGGIYNGYGRRAVVFPDDDHPDLCSAVLDITGDPRDEIVTWNQNEIWVYTQEDGNRQGRVYQPERNPLYNYSNYQFTRSWPNWND